MVLIREEAANVVATDFMLHSEALGGKMGKTGPTEFCPNSKPFQSLPPESQALWRSMMAEECRIFKSWSSRCTLAFKSGNCKPCIQAELQLY